MRRPEPTRGDTSKFAYRFDTVSNSASFKVVLSSVEHHEVVTFRLGAKSISATDTNGDEMFEATLTLNDEGDCRFKIKGQKAKTFGMLAEWLLSTYFSVSAKWHISKNCEMLFADCTARKQRTLKAFR